MFLPFGSRESGKLTLCSVLLFTLVRGSADTKENLFSFLLKIILIYIIKTELIATQCIPFHCAFLLISKEIFQRADLWEIRPVHSFLLDRTSAASAWREGRDQAGRPLFQEARL